MNTFDHSNEKKSKNKLVAKQLIGSLVNTEVDSRKTKFMNAVKILDAMLVSGTERINLKSKML